MTTEEALKIDPARYSVHGDVATALRVLADALREAQATVAQMREDAARVVMREAANYETAIQKAIGDPAQLDRWSDCRDELAELAAEIRALPAPAARTYEDGVRDCAGRIVQSVHERPCGLCRADLYAVAAVEALLSPAPVAAPKPVAFDAEAALVAMLEFVSPVGPGPHIYDATLPNALRAALKAGREP